MTHNNIYTTFNTLVVLTRTVLWVTSVEPMPAAVNFDNKTVTACKIPLLDCPISDIDKEMRELCFYGYTGSRCPNGQFYGCGRDKDNGFLVEGCFGRHICPAGSSNRVVVNLDTSISHLECTGCDVDHYQSISTDSSVESFNGCSQKRSSDTLQNEMPKMVQIEVGWPTRPDKYACDVNKGYSDSNKQFYCYVTRPCSCTMDVVCLDKGKLDLLPDGSCDDECKANRNPTTNYTCASYKTPTSKPESNANLTDNFEHDKASQSAWLWIGGIVVVVVLVCILILWKTSCYKKDCFNLGSFVNRMNPFKKHAADDIEMYRNIEVDEVEDVAPNQPDDSPTENLNEETLDSIEARGSQPTCEAVQPESLDSSLKHDDEQSNVDDNFHAAESNGSL